MRFKKWMAALLVAALMLGGAACGGGGGDAGGAAPETRSFTDSAGRTVELPGNVEKIAPSGPLAQIVLFTACPDRLAGIALDFPDAAKGLIDDSYWNLPKFGQFYGKNASLNMEALVAAAPDAVVDIGEAKETIREDMDGLQEQLGIPTIFIEATLETMPEAYSRLGELTGMEKETKKLGDYCKEVLDKADTVREGLTDDAKVSIYHAGGDKGLNTNAVGSFHAEIIEKVGGRNVAEVEVVPQGTGSEISMEQLLLWDPDVIIADSDEVYQLILTDKAWAQLSAVKAGKVYAVPDAPYNFIGRPPSVNRIIGILWLGNILYPEQYGVDMKKELITFYDLFYHVKIDEAKAKEILKEK